MAFDLLAQLRGRREPAAVQHQRDGLASPDISSQAQTIQRVQRTLKRVPVNHRQILWSTGPGAGIPPRRGAPDDG